MRPQYVFFAGLCALLAALLFLVTIFGSRAFLEGERAEIKIGFSIVAASLGLTGLVLLLAAKKLRSADAFLHIKDRELEKKNIELEYAKEATLSVLKDLNVEKENLAAAKAKDEAILASIGDGVLVIDAKGTIILFNGAAEKISGYSAHQAIGKRYSEILIFKPEGKDTIDNSFIEDALKGKGGSMKEPMVLQRKDASLVPVSDSAAPVKDSQDHVQGAVVVFRDVTEERRIDRVKTEFVSLASHQLRTPPTIVSYYAEMLLAGDAGKISKKQLDFINEIYGASKRMIELVHGLLNVTRLELGTFSIEPEPVRIADVVQSAFKNLALQIKQKQIEIKESYSDAKLVLQGDPKIVLVIIDNLLTNALKYTPKQGSVSIHVEEVGDRIRITVKDSGCGIPVAAQQKIFSKMYRAPNAQIIDPQGTGLGLYMVKSILDHLGGSIRFESVEGKGTTFYVELPKSGMAAKKGTTKIV